ncbi:LysR family transcriptional regulator substrate-binding protein [Bacillus sp. NPDC077027]|uniref:LysR family transcriptional regulator substrate-binding protein n=1 Tax=Bacillus sp. NPDC077027 TaxID=3390548 RepID=UPI003D052C2F
MAFQTSHIQTAQSLVKHGFGVTVVPKMIDREEANHLIYLGLDSSSTRILVFAYIEERYLSRTAQVFMEMATAIGESPS